MEGNTQGGPLASAAKNAQIYTQRDNRDGETETETEKILNVSSVRLFADQSLLIKIIYQVISPLSKVPFPEYGEENKMASLAVV